jgi:spore germination protein KB
MNNRVTSKQITHAAVIFIISTSLLTKPLYTFTKNDAWIAVLAGFVVVLCITVIYAALINRFPGMSIIEINECVFGPVIGRLMSVLYIYFYYTIACLDTNVISGFIKEIVLPDTPMILIVFLFLIVCIWAVRKGPTNLMKYSMLFSVVSMIIIGLNMLLLIKNIDLRNLLPFMVLPVKDYISGIHSVALIPLSDPFLLIMFIPEMSKPKAFVRAISKGLVIGVVTLFIIVIRDITVLGRVLDINSFPSFSTIRLIDVGDFLTRMDIVYISVLIALMFYKVAVLLYVAISALQKLLRFDSYQFLLHAFGALLLIYTLNVVKSSSDHMKWLLDGSAEFHHMFFVVILPLATLVTAFCRGFFRSVDQEITEGNGGGPV